MSGTKDFSINKKKNGLLKFFIVGAVILIFLVVLNFFNHGIRNAFYAVSAPLQKDFWLAGGSSSGFLASIASAGSLSKKNQDLQNKIQKLDLEVAFLQSIVNGNQAQSMVSQACQNNGFKLLMAGVVGLGDQDILSIDKGSADGISEGMPVINQQGALYGKILKVYKNFSQVMLISSKNSVISVKIQAPVAATNPPDNSVVSTGTAQPEAKPADSAHKSAAPKEIDGVIKGLGNLKIFLDLVPVDDTINSGDTLLTSKLDASFPINLLVGTIKKVEKNDQKPHQQAQVQSFLDSSADNLFVVTNYKK